MIICKDYESLQRARSHMHEQEQSLAFVPTMGALHDGHISLVELAKTKAAKVAVSIFVNPTQFAPHEDFDSYPRDIESDLKKLEKAGVALVYLPQEHDIYPHGKALTVKAGKQAKGLESDFRPHFFDGVTTVVKTLFDQVRPQIAIFGEKDYQQLLVISEMVQNEGLDIQIIGAPIARDEFGLALSSRNAYLSSDELEIARMLNQVLYKAAYDISEKRDENEALSEANQNLLAAGFDKIDYFSVRGHRVLCAAWLGITRLIDNTEIPKSLK